MTECWFSSVQRVGGSVGRWGSQLLRLGDFTQNPRRECKRDVTTATARLFLCSACNQRDSDSKVVGIFGISFNSWLYPP
jgi:hypothetical protein